MQVRAVLVHPILGPRCGGRPTRELAVCRKALRRHPWRLAALLKHFCRRECYTAVIRRLRYRGRTNGGRYP